MSTAEKPQKSRPTGADTANKEPETERRLLYSICGHDFSFDSLEEAAAAMRARWGYIRAGSVRKIWEADGEKHDASFLLPDVAQVLMYNACEEFPDYGPDWTFTEEQERSLQDAVVDAVGNWADKHDMHPDFCYAYNPRLITIRFLDKSGAFEVVKRGPVENQGRFRYQGQQRAQKTD